MVNQDIEEIENKIKTLEEKEREEAEEAAGGPAKKAKYDIKKKLEELKANEQLEQSKPIEDLMTVKLRNLPNDMTEDEIYNAMLKFGPIEKVKIPTEEGRNGKMRSRGFAFVSY